MPWHPFPPERLTAIQQGAVVSQCEPLRYIEPQFIPMYRPGILMVEGHARWVDPQPCPEQIGDLFAWKIAHLNM
ncbi:MAG: hypothetical protein JXB13_03705 [Phycisphaerae bacterium]|nr:hypothetical protein [Phycisphaerae bacterium]